MLTRQPEHSKNKAALANLATCLFSPHVDETTGVNVLGIKASVAGSLLGAAVFS